MILREMQEDLIAWQLMDVHPKVRGECLESS